MEESREGRDRCSPSSNMSAGPSGFNNAPVARAFIVGTAVFSFVFAVTGRTPRTGLSYQDVFNNLRLGKLFSSIFAFSSTPELICGLYLLYYFRVFERQIGSNKYSVFIMFSILVSSLLELLSLTLFKDSTLKILASGPYGLVFSSFVPFFFDIPVTSRTRIFGITFTDKSFTYFVGLQLLLSSWKSSLLPGFCGVLAGSFYRLNLFGIRRAKLPEFLASFFSRFFLPSPGRSSQGNPANGNIARNLPPYSDRRSELNYAAPAVGDPPEESIATLVSMGFDTNSARQALVRARNDIQVATNILLEAQSR